MNIACYEYILECISVAMYIIVWLNKIRKKCKWKNSSLLPSVGWRIKKVSILTMRFISECWLYKVLHPNKIRKAIFLVLLRCCFILMYNNLGFLGFGFQKMFFKTLFKYTFRRCGANNIRVSERMPAADMVSIPCRFSLLETHPINTMLKIMLVFGGVSTSVDWVNESNFNAVPFFPFLRLNEA